MTCQSPHTTYIQTHTYKTTTNLFAQQKNIPINKHQYFTEFNFWINKYSKHNLVISKITRLNYLVPKISVDVKFFKRIYELIFIQWHLIVFPIIDEGIYILIPNEDILYLFLIPDGGIACIFNSQNKIYTVTTSQKMITNSYIIIKHHSR